MTRKRRLEVSFIELNKSVEKEETRGKFIELNKSVEKEETRGKFIELIKSVEEEETESKFLELVKSVKRRLGVSFKTHRQTVTKENLCACNARYIILLLHPSM